MRWLRRLRLRWQRWCLIQDARDPRTDEYERVELAHRILDVDYELHHKEGG
jgi:hypothetical protein